jgi:hypothetical protein
VWVGFSTALCIAYKTGAVEFWEERLESYLLSRFEDDPLYEDYDMYREDEEEQDLIDDTKEENE